MKRFLPAAALLLMLASCSERRPLDAVPRNAVIVVAMDAPRTGLTLVDIALVDTTQRGFLFETADGLFGFAGACRATETDARLEGGRWACAFADGRMVALGPILPAQKDDALRRAKRLLEQDDEESFASTALCERLDSARVPMALVAKTAALPEQLKLALTLGLPGTIDERQACVAATLTTTDSLLVVNSTLFSPNADADRAIRQAAAVFRPIRGTFSNDCNNRLLSVVMNARGSELLPLIQQNKQMQLLLSGVNTVIDMDNILRAADGDIALMVSDAKMNMEIRAQLASDQFLNDVGYWKESCPSGTRFIDKGGRRWLVESAGSDFIFGVNDSNEFYATLTHKGNAAPDDFLLQAMSLLRAAGWKAVVFQTGG